MWNHRAQIAVKYLGNHSRRVLDYGSGSGYIRTILPASVKAYHGVDVRPHAAYAAEVCNINDGFVTAVPTKDSEQRYDRIFVLGVLEYVCKPAEFLNFLSSPEIQAKWHQDTGYLPITQASFDLTREQGYYDENPGADISIQQMNLNEPTENSRGLRFGNYVQIRDIVSEEMEAMIIGTISAQQAADNIVERGNALLRDFESAMQ